MNETRLRALDIALQLHNAPNAKQLIAEADIIEKWLRGIVEGVVAEPSGTATLTVPARADEAPDRIEVSFS